MKKKHEAVLREALAKGCPNLIPRSGESGSEVDCFSVFYETPKTEFSTLISEINNGYIHCKSFNAKTQSYDIQTKLRLNLCDQKYFVVSHYDGLATINFTTLDSLWWGRRFRYIYFKIWLAKKYDNVKQNLLNLKSLDDVEHIKFLRFLLEKNLSGVREFDNLSLLTMRHTRRWYARPDSENMRVAMRHRLALLVDAGLLVKFGNANSKYRITGEVINFIERHNDDERRHRDNILIQWLLGALTVVLTVSALDQAGVIDLSATISFVDKSNSNGNP